MKRFSCFTPDSQRRTNLNEQELLRKLVEMYSPSGREAAVASQLHSWLSAQAVFDEVLIDKAGNVVARSGPEPYLLLCGHLDTVPGKLRVRIRGEALWGRGAVDAKGPLVAMAAASARCAGLGMKGILFAGVVGEERYSRGIKHLISRWHGFLGGVFGEPTHTSRIGVSYRGRLGVSLTVQGSASHAASPSKDLNTIESAVNRALALKRDLNRFNCLTTITRIHGGVADNVNPPNCTLQLDVRIPIERSLDEITAEIQRQNSKNLQVRIYEEIPPVNVGRVNIVFNAAARALSETGCEPVAVAKMGTSDMNLFYANQRVPCIALGPGDSSLSHSDREHMQLKDFRRAIDIYSRIIRNMCSEKLRIASVAA